MKAIITGMNGAVAPFIYEELKKHNIDTVIWDRSKTGTDTEEVVYDFIRESKPDLFFHIATGPVEWVEYIAKATKELDVKLIFTSSVSVFSEKGSGPYYPDSIPDAEEDYGLYKIACENAVRNLNPEAIILRLGWQIGSASGSNNMIDFLTRAQKEQGYIEASSKWFPSCSFLEDTAKTIVEVSLEYDPDTYLLNANRDLTFFHIICHLKDKYHTEWNIRETTSLNRDDRMYDDRIKIRKLFSQPE